MGFQVTFDANDPSRLADFWALALDYVIQPAPPEFDSWDDWAEHMGIPRANWNDARALVDPAGEGPRLFFQIVPETKVAKNRVHLDVNVGGGPGVAEDERRGSVDAKVAQLVEAGATVAGPVEQRGEYWVVLHDPEGNEFCVQ